MKAFQTTTWLAGAVLAGLAACGAPQPPAPEESPAAGPLAFERLAPLAPPHGLAAPFAGVSDGALLVAGGANFPDRPPWQGGTKVWHDAVFALRAPHAAWEQAGRLPRPLAYGASVSWNNAVLCFGGSDARRHYADAFALSLEHGVLRTRALPPLPAPCANMAWAMAGSTLYLAGGLAAPEATNCLPLFWSLDLARPGRGWNILDPGPVPPRMLAVAGARDAEFFLFSGVALVPGPEGRPRREYLRDAWRYSPAGGWTRLPDLPRAAAAAPSPAPFHQGRFLIFSGDDGARLGFEPPEAHPGFPRDALAYLPATGQWRAAGPVPFSLATVPVVSWGERLVIPGGETRPGIRSTEVWTFSTRNQQSLP